MAMVWDDGSQMWVDDTSSAYQRQQQDLKNSNTGWLDTPGATGNWNDIKGMFGGAATPYQVKQNGFFLARPDSTYDPATGQITVGKQLLDAGLAKQGGFGEFLKYAIPAFGGAALAGTYLSGLGAASGGFDPSFSELFSDSLGGYGGGGIAPDIAAASSGAAGVVDPSWGVNPRFDALNSTSGAPLQDQSGNAFNFDSSAGGTSGATGGGTSGGGFNMDYFTNTPTSTIVQQLTNAGVDPSKALSMAQQLAGGPNAPSTTGIPYTQLLQGATSLLNGVIGSNAARQAANAQIQASDAATNEQRRQFDITQANNAPFLATGTAANQRLSQLLGTSPGYTGADSGSLIKPFSASDLNADPVYQSGLQFGLDQGTKGINARAIGSGMYDSGATLKALTQFGNDYGSTKANDAYNRYTNNQGNVYNKLAGVSGTGQTAVNQIATTGQNTANAISGNITDVGNSRAASVVGGANAWGSALGGVGNAANNYQSNQILQALLQRNGTST